MGMESLEICIHADESCLGNQFSSRSRPGGAAALLEFCRSGSWVRRDIWTSRPSTTNNRMAITSAILPLEALKAPSKIRFVSDSQYLVKGATEWMSAWKRRKWKRKGGPVQNLELWQRLDRLAAAHDIAWEWIRGHSGHPKNEYVDGLAVRAAQEQSSSSGAVPSGFVEWLNRERKEKKRYLDYAEFPLPESFTAP